MFIMDFCGFFVSVVKWLLGVDYAVLNVLSLQLCIALKFSVAFWS